MKTSLRIAVTSHVVLLILAATNFTALSWVWGDVSWSCAFFNFGYSNGYGYSYVSDYSLAQVICYIVAYGFGMVVFRSFWIAHRWRACFLGGILSVLGMISFGVEASHWFWNHHLSLIISFPVLVLLIWMFVAFRLQKPFIPKQAQQVAASDR